MEKKKFNGFDSQEKLDTVMSMVGSALNALTDCIYIEFYPHLGITEITAEYCDHTLELNLNLFDGLYSVSKYDGDEEVNWLDKVDLDIIRRVDAISEHLIDAVYVHEYTEGKSGGSWSRSETEDETETEGE